MKTAEKPLLFGYHSARSGLPIEHLMDVRTKLTAFASAEGYALAGIFSEATEQPATALQALLESAERRHVEAVAVPSLEDLGANWGVQQLARKRLADAGVRLLVLVGGA
ncbi:MAG TPA: hypothetical protein VLL08_31400 [Kineosporiaceae bacterium]|nr:hypothetical protein [Kineosporiaceae bacterium]